MKKWLLLGAVATVAVAVFAWQASQPTEPADTETSAAEEPRGGVHQENELEIPEDMVRDLRITTTVVESRSDAEQSTITGELRVDENNYAEVAAPVSGRVSRLYATVGESVRAGQPLADIQSADLGRARAAIETATARVELARNVVERKRLLAILAGIYKADEGEILLDGKRVEVDSPASCPGARHRHHPSGTEPDARLLRRRTYSSAASRRSSAARRWTTPSSTPTRPKYSPPCI